ncbi:hypothetical protein [Nocardia alni]|uniref:hypothetical protein n=1 Tax=Nocardia alni TaxID=2815723 RepID=UPI001C2100B5|nr:hypothetical protein [Nocardia alni]
MSDTTDVLTRSEYTRKRKAQQAGPVSELMPGTVERFKQLYPDWKAKNWHVSPGAYGLHLGPVNLVRDTPQDEVAGNSDV